MLKGLLHSLRRQVRFRIRRNRLTEIVSAKESVTTGYDAGTKVALTALLARYQELRQRGMLPRFEDTGFRVFSQFDEDGKILFLLAVLGIRSRFFVDIGAADGINSNCANLAVNFSFRGVFLEGDAQNVATATAFYRQHPDTKYYPPMIRRALVTADNVNDLLQDARVPDEPDLLTIDIDGNDFHIWNALTCCQPRIVVIETHVLFGNRDIVVPYDPTYFFPGKHRRYHGASAPAMIALGQSKGYRCVGTNNLGFNLFFVRNDLAGDVLPEVTVESILQHPRTQSEFQLFEPISDWPFVSSASLLRKDSVE